MGLLPAYQLAGILAGNRIRQRWRIHQPTTSAHTAYNWTTIHDDDDRDYRSVIDAGKRIVTGYNVAMAQPGELRVGSYSITVENSGGLFYPGTADSIWTCPAPYSYQADPQECLLEHNVYVWYDGAWRELTPVAYIGRVVDVRFEDGGNHDGAQPGTCVITSENNLVTELLRYEWTEDDGDDTDTTINLYQDT